MTSANGHILPQIDDRLQTKSAVPTVPLNGTAQNDAFQRDKLRRSGSSYTSIPPPGSLLTGKQEHYLKRELIAQQTQYEVGELASPTALQRFGAPFRSDSGEVSPEDSELPILRYIFVHHVRNFPFLDQAREKEFWQDKLQVFLESFAKKHVSSSEDRLEETKRRKLAIKAEKLVELMMVSGIPTASGYEERIRFSELEIIDRGANEQGLLVNVPDGAQLNGWDVNVAGVRTTSVKRTLRYHQHAEFLLRVKQLNKPEVFVGRRYGDFAKMHKRLRMELPGKVLPPLPRKNKSHSAISTGADDDEADSVSSSSIQTAGDGDNGGSGIRGYLGLGGLSGRHGRQSSRTSLHDMTRRSTSRSRGQEPVVLLREDQRVSLRAFLRTVLLNEQIANSKAMTEFLTNDPITLNEEELTDIERRKHMDERRIEEQKQFYEIARRRAQELDVHMEKFRRDIVESNGLTKLFAEIREKDRIADLKPEYKKFAEWLRIEVAATLYHIFLAEDNSPEMFAQAKRIHSLIPYVALKNVIRIANPAAVMKGVLDLFLAQPFGARSLMQRILGMALGDSIKSVQRSIDSLTKVDDPVLTQKILAYTDAPEDVKNEIRSEAGAEQTDLLVCILRSEYFQPELTPEQIGRMFNAYVAWHNAVENVDEEMKHGAELYAHLKQLLKLYTRQRDKRMMVSIIEEPVTLHLFRDLFTIFYEPLVRVYKSANVYSSITDFAVFADDAIKTIEAAQRADISADPNQTVQAFIDVCARHENNFYKFVHEVHIHDNGLFDQLMGWLEGILHFLRHGPKSGLKLDMNALVRGALDMGIIESTAATKEINSLIRWQEARKKWHQDKTRQKMAAEGTAGGGSTLPGMSSWKSSDFGLNELDLQDLELDASADEDSEDEEGSLDELDPIAAERRRRAKRRDVLRRGAGEPVKPEIREISKLKEAFLTMLRGVLSDP